MSIISFPFDLAHVKFRSARRNLSQNGLLHKWTASRSIRYYMPKSYIERSIEPVVVYLKSSAAYPACM
jgi:hypothetical protein